MHTTTAAPSERSGPSPNEPVHSRGRRPAEALVYGILKLQERIQNGETSPVVVKPYELEEFGDLPEDELVQKLASEIDEDDLVMRYNWADSP